MVLFPTHPSDTIAKHTGPVHCVTYSSPPTQSYLLTGGADRKIHLFNASTTSHIQTYDSHGYEVLCIAVSHDNARFASVGGDKAAFLWDVTTAKTLRRFAGHYGRINACGFNADASVLVTGSFDTSVRLWDVKSQSTKPIMVWDDAKDSVTSLLVGDGVVTTSSVDGKVRSYDLRMGEVTVDTLPAAVTCLTSTRDGGSGVLVGTLDGTVRLMDVGSGGCLKSYKGHRNTEYRVGSTLIMGDMWVVSGSEDGVVWGWDIVEGRVVSQLKAHGGKVVSAVAGCDGRKEMVTAGVDGTVVVWRCK